MKQAKKWYVIIITLLGFITSLIISYLVFPEYGSLVFLFIPLITCATFFLANISSERL